MIHDAFTTAASNCLNSFHISLVKSHAVIPLYKSCFGPAISFSPKLTFCLLIMYGTSWYSLYCIATRSRTTAMWVNIHWNVSCWWKIPDYTDTRLTNTHFIVAASVSYSTVCSLFTCAERLFLFRLFSFLLRRTPVSFERPNPLLTLDSLDWVAGARASPRLTHFFSYTEQQQKIWAVKWCTEGLTNLFGN